MNIEKRISVIEDDNDISFFLEKLVFETFTNIKYKIHDRLDEFMEYEESQEPADVYILDGEFFENENYGSKGKHLPEALKFLVKKFKGDIDAVISRVIIYSSGSNPTERESFFIQYSEIPDEIKQSRIKMIQKSIGTEEILKKILIEEFNLE